MTTTDVEGSEWMKIGADFVCKRDPESFFYEAELNYEASFSLICEKNLIFGGKFPYWNIPGTHYPNKTEIICALPTICYDFIDIDYPLRMLGLSDTFDNFNDKKDNSFDFICSDDNRGILSFFPIILK